MDEDQEAIIQDLLDRWERLRAQGLQISVSELCAEYSDLTEEVQGRIDGLVRFELFESDRRSDTNVDSINGYQLLERIGYGATSDVYLCQKPPLRRKSALKLLRQAVPGSISIERFRREAELVSKLAHPSIVPLYDFGETDDGRPYFVMEYVDGTSITDWASTKEPQEVLRATQDILAALEVAHKVGVVHCDIKPSNVMVDLNDNVKLLDFGVSKAMTKDFHTITQDASQAAMGTLGYMAPEQLTGRTNVDRRVDVFGAGALLYELLTRIPMRNIEGLGLSQVIQSVQRGKVEPIEEVAPEIAPTLAAIVHQSIAKKPSHRYQTAEEFRDDLDRYLEGDTANAMVRQATARMTRRVLIGLAIAAVLAVIFAFLPDSRKSPNLASEANQPVTRNERLQLVEHPDELTTRQTKYTSGVATGLGFAPDNPVGGIEWLHGCAKEDREFSWYFLLWCHRRTHGKKTYPRLVTALRWDEARHRFYFGDNQGNLGYYSKSMEQYGELESPLGSRTNDFAISPDGSLMVAIAKKGTHAFYDLDTMERLPLGLAEDVKLCRSVWFTSDGSKLITIQRTGQASIWSAKDGTFVEEWDMGQNVTVCDYSPATDQIAVAHPKSGIRVGNLAEKTWSENVGEEKSTGLKFDKEGKGLLASTPSGFTYWNLADLQIVKRYPLSERFRPFDVVRAGNASNWVFQEKHDGLCFVRRREDYRIGRLIQCGVVAGYDVTDDGRWVVYGRNSRSDSDPATKPVIGRWDLRPWKAKHVLPVAGDITAVSCSTDGRQFVFAADGQLKQLELEQPQPKLLYQAEEIQAICTLDKSDIAYATETELVIIRNGMESRVDLCGVTKIVNASEELLLATKSGGVVRLAGDSVDELGTCDGPLIWLGKHDEAILALGANGDLCRLFDGHVQAKFDLGMMPTSARRIGDDLFVVGGNKLLQLNIPLSEMTESELELNEKNTLLAISPDGQTLAFANSLGTLGFLDPVIGAKRFEFQKSFTGPAKGIGFSADGKVLYVVGGDNKIHVWTPFEFPPFTSRLK